MKISSTVLEGKVIVVGDFCTGKTSIIQQYSNGIFREQTESTIAACYISVKVPNDTGEVTLHIWDTAGQERYKSLIPMYSRNAAAAIIVVDLSNANSYKSLDHWMEVIKQSCPNDCRVYCIGNKTDLEPAFPAEELKKWASEHRIDLFLTTARDRSTIIPVFNSIASQIFTASNNVVVGNMKSAETKENREKCC